MFIHTWNKYLPVIRILLKRSVVADQTLDMNQSDFRRAAAGKKIKFAFSLEMTNGRAKGDQMATSIAKDFVTALQMDDSIIQFLRQKRIEFTMNSNFQLLIKNIAMEQVTDPA